MTAAAHRHGEQDILGRAVVVGLLVVDTLGAALPLTLPEPTPAQWTISGLFALGAAGAALHQIDRAPRTSSELLWLSCAAWAAQAAEIASRDPRSWDAGHRLAVAAAAAAAASWFLERRARAT